MSADLDSEHDLIARSVERLFAERVRPDHREQVEAGEFDPQLWQLVVEAGLPHMLATEAAGGLGQGWISAFPVLRALGYWQVPLPLAETMIVAQLASMAGLNLIDGPLTMIEQGGDGSALGISGDGAAVRIDGTAHRVPWARHARAVLISLADGRIALLPLRDTQGLRIVPQVNVAGLPSDTVVFDAVALPCLALNPLALAQPVWTLGALARSAMMVGALESALVQTVRYANERVQFGKPIGRNQAIQHGLALMAGDVAAARMAARVAAADAPTVNACDGAAALFSIAVAKARAGEAATRGAAIAHQVHGAIGFTQEHSLHHATRSLWAWREEFGTDAQWAQRLGRAAIQARGAGFWPGVTGKRLA